MDHTAYQILQQDLTPSPTHDARAHSMQNNFEVIYGALKRRTTEQNRILFATVLEAWKSGEVE